MTSVQGYLDSVPEKRKNSVMQLHQLISTSAPELEQKYWEYGGGLIGYGEFHYKYKSGREGDWYMLGLGNRKAYISVYSFATPDNHYLVEDFAAQLPGNKIGKSCINIRKPELIDDAVITQLVRETVAFFKETYPASFSR